MSNKTKLAKGYRAEELVRGYFLRAGFFVLRGIKLRHEGAVLSDIDVWIYERSATLARRRMIIDVKDKGKPQAAERFFFIKGLASVLAVEGAGVATSENRPALRELAQKHGLLWIDGSDLQRLKSSEALAELGRLSEEDFYLAAGRVDKERNNGNLYVKKVDDLKSAVANRFGPSCANLALETFSFFAREVVISHPGSAAAEVAVRLSYFAASIAAAALDFASADVALRPSTERVRYLAGAIRFGSDIAGTVHKLEWAKQAIRDFLPNGAALAQAVHTRLNEAADAVPAEDLAVIAAHLSKGSELFNIARSLENQAYAEPLVGFDHLDASAKTFLGALLDFAGMSRAGFAMGWEACRSEQGGRGPGSNTSPKLL